MGIQIDRDARPNTRYWSLVRRARAVRGMQYATALAGPVSAGVTPRYSYQSALIIETCDRIHQCTSLFFFSFACLRQVRQLNWSWLIARGTKDKTDNKIKSTIYYPIMDGRV